MEDYTALAWIDSLSRRELEDFLDDPEPVGRPPLLHPWPSPNLRHFLVPGSPERSARQEELMEKSKSQHGNHKGASNYPTIQRQCEMQAEWEEMCRLSKGIRRLQGRSLPRLEESERSLRLRLFERIRIAQMAGNDEEGSLVPRNFHHLNLYGDQVYTSSKTAACHSYWAAKSFGVGTRNILLGKNRKRIADRVRASQATRWLDPVVLAGRKDLDGQGSALCNEAARWAMRAYLPGQGTWDSGEALEQRSNMKVTSRDPRLNARIMPVKVTRQYNDVQVNDDGRWHPPPPPRKETLTRRRPSPLFQVQAVNEVEDIQFDESGFLNERLAWLGRYLNEHGYSYDVSRSELENSEGDLGQYDEVRIAAMKFMKSISGYLMSFRGFFGQRRKREKL